MPKRRQRTWTDDQLREAARDNTTISGVLRDLGLSTSAGNFRTFHRYVKELEIDTSHFLGCAWVREAGWNPGTKWTLEQILVKDSPYRGTGQQLRKKLLKAGLLEEKCYKCGLPPEWEGEPLTLQLDHINGEPADHRLENLRLLCPNCHTQTRNFCSRNKKGRYRKPPRTKTCVDCGDPVSYSALRCQSCAGKFRGNTKINWPSLEELERMLQQSNFSAVGRVLGVSDNAIRKHLRKLYDERDGGSGGI